MAVKPDIISGRLIDIVNQRIYPVRLYIEDQRIARVEPIDKAESDNYILPGFIDAHVHIESSMLVPSEFARLAVVHGTVGTVSDPHEIGNVMGIEGVRFMIQNGNEVPFKFAFGAPSCVPATSFETAGATINSQQIEELFKQDGIKYLAEMMDWPGVLNNDAGVMQKIAIAKKYKKPIDGHAPGLRGKQAEIYIKAGMSTDHECFTAEEALDKLKHGMKIIIREGSAAKNFEALIDLLDEYPDQIMFCSDDKHPDNLVEGHINQLVKRALGKGIDLFKVLKAACVNPVLHYGLDVGLLRHGDPADFILIDSPQRMNVLATYVDGKKVAEKGKSLIKSVKVKLINQFAIGPIAPESLHLPVTGNVVNVIEVMDGQLITNKKQFSAGKLPDISRDVLKLVVVNRYQSAPPAVAYIRNMGLKAGAIASCVAHDSHNIIAVGVDDASICRSVNLIIEAKGGISAVDGKRELVLPLPIAGIMSGERGEVVAEAYSNLDAMAKDMGSELQSPFMSLSFMALLVIPSIKLSDKGLFNGDTFELINVFETMENQSQGSAEKLLKDFGKKIDELIADVKKSDLKKEAEKGVEQLKKDAKKLEEEFKKFKEENKDKWQESGSHLEQSARELKRAVEALFKK